MAWYNLTILLLISALAFYSEFVGRKICLKQYGKDYYPGRFGYAIKGMLYSRFSWPLWLMILLLIAGYFGSEQERKFNKKENSVIMR